jgi:leucyl aminopeptidase (aminopeptidase T)
MAPRAVDGEDARLATSILTRSLRLRRGESVIIETWSDNVPFAETVVVQARRLGIRPMVLYEGETSFFESQRVAGVADAAAIATPELAALATTDAYLYLPGPADLHRWAELPEARRSAIDRWLTTWNRTARDRAVRACYAFFATPSESSAREFGVDLDAWRRETRTASALDPADLRRSARRIAQRLRTGRRVTVTHPNGTELDLALAGRVPFVEDGSVDEDDLRNGHNWTVLPGGFIVVALDERVADGKFIANRPSAHNRGLNAGIRWTFRGGRLTSYVSDDPTGVFTASYRAAGRERERPAILSVGLNPHLHHAPLQDDQILGMVSLFIGSNDNLRGRTRGPFRDYALLEGADVRVDGHPIVSAGEPV